VSRHQSIMLNSATEPMRSTNEIHGTQPLRRSQKWEALIQQTGSPLI
jgi:hypothetical protein